MSTTDKADVDTTNSTPKEDESNHQDDKGNNKNENTEEVTEGSLSSNTLTNHNEQTTLPSNPKITTTKATTTDEPGLSGNLNSPESNTAANTPTCVLQSESVQQRKDTDSISSTTKTPEGTGATTTTGKDDQSKPEQVFLTGGPAEKAPSQDKHEDHENGKCHNHSDQYDSVCSNLIKPRQLAGKETIDKTTTDVTTNEPTQQDNTLTKQGATQTEANTDNGKCINHIDQYDLLFSNLITTPRLYRKRLDQ